MDTDTRGFHYIPQEPWSFNKVWQIEKEIKTLLTSFCSAKARHHLWRSLHVSKGQAPLRGRRHHAHPLQRRGEGEALDDGHGHARLTRRWRENRRQHVRASQCFLSKKKKKKRKWPGQVQTGISSQLGLFYTLTKQ